MKIYFAAPSTHGFKDRNRHLKVCNFCVMAKNKITGSLYFDVCLYAGEIGHLWWILILDPAVSKDKNSSDFLRTYYHTGKATFLVRRPIATNLLPSIWWLLCSTRQRPFIHTITTSTWFQAGWTTTCNLEVNALQKILSAFFHRWWILAVPSQNVTFTIKFTYNLTQLKCIISR